jgi:DNA (cytosine-5)-methyltransferase 1
MTAYYNEIDPYAAAWLRNLVAAGRIAPGDVDERSIRDVKPDDLKGYTQCHFFAGIGVWSAALRLAGWADDRPVWTGSCPCQPFSAAGKGGGFDDERHLWPDLFRLIAECKPGVVFGEQVASKDGLAWLDLVQADLEGANYASGAVDLCAAGVGAPHIRQRLYWLADAAHQQQHGSRDAGSSGRDEHSDGGANSRLADANGGDTSAEREQRSGEQRQQSEDSGAGSVADADDARLSVRECPAVERAGWRDEGRAAEQPGGAYAGGESAARPTNGQWRDADWLFCRDGKWRPVEPGTFPLVNGAVSRVGRLRAYGNAIVAQVAAEVIAAWMDFSLEGKD